MKGDLYRFFDARGQLLYVGQSLHAARRASQHKRDKPWWDSVHRMDVEQVPLEELTNAESTAIATEHPIHNVIRPALPEVPYKRRPLTASQIGVLLTQTEAAAYLGHSRNKVREWTRNGLIPVLFDPESSRPMYPRPALDAWMAALGTEHARKVAS